MLTGVLCVCFNFIHSEDIMAEHHFSPYPNCCFSNINAKCVHCGKEYKFSIWGPCNDNLIKYKLRRMIDVLNED